MDLKILLDTPPWEWPEDSGKMFLEALIDSRANESKRLIAAELAGDLTVINDDLADALLAIIGSAEETEQLRARAAISLGAVLEQADTDGFEYPDDVPISERKFHHIQDSLQKLYLDSGNPKEVRRRILEASVRAPANWQESAIRAAYGSGDQEWMLTAVFSMRWVRGFDEQILEALKSADPEIHYEAVHACGNWELDAAWPHIVTLLSAPGAPKPLLLAAISATSIRPLEAMEILEQLAASGDEEISEAAEEAIAMAEPDYDESDDEDEIEWTH